MMHPVLVERAQAIRDAVGVMLGVNSGVRCAAHNAKVKGHPRSFHLSGHALDLSIWHGVLPVHLLGLAAAAINPGGTILYLGRGFIHIDCRDLVGMPRYVGVDRGILRGVIL